MYGCISNIWHYNGKKYILGLKNGKIGQFYPN